MQLMLRQHYLFFIFCIVSSAATAQQTWGIMGSNYAGVSNIDLNPSSMVLSKCSWDLNIVSADASLLNNSFYLKPKFIFPALFNPQLTFATSSASDAKNAQTADIVLNSNIQKTTFLAIAANIKGPSFMYSDGNDAFAITTGFRTGVSTFNLPQALVRLGYENLDYPSLYNQSLTVNKGISAATMAWFELGGSYARKLAENQDFIYTGGVSLKFLVGFSGGYAMSNGINYLVPYRANFTATNLNLEYGHAINSEKAPVAMSNPLGKGVSADIGFTIVRKKRGRSSPFYGCPKLTEGTALRNIGKNYKWKLGFSIIDIGGINFGTHAEDYTYTNVAYSWDTVNRVNAKKLAEVDQLIYSRYSQNGNATYKNSFFIWTPTAASVQFDYNFNGFFYANLSIVQRLVITTSPHLARMNSIALTPRYETPFFEVAMPLILNEYQYPNIGLMVRYRYFFIGSDQIGSTLGLTSLYGFNLYAGIKISYLGRVGKSPRVVY